MKHLSVFILVCLLLATGCGGGNGDNLSLGGVTPDDIDCFQDDLNHVEPLPEGSFPSEIITEPGTFWRCDIEDVKIYDDGTTVSTYTGDPDEEGYLALRIIEEACGLASVELPQAKFNWVVTPDGLLCQRAEITPGFILCSPYDTVYSSRDGKKTAFSPQRTVTKIQYGWETATSVAPEGTCYLEEE